MNRSASSYWYNSWPRVLQAFPYHWIIQPSEEEIKQVFRDTHAIALRYSTPVDAPHGRISYHVLCEDEDFDITSMRHKARLDVKHGLEYACIERIPFERLAGEGWQLRQETMARQGRDGAENGKWWRSLCLSAEGLPGVEAWGAFHENQLVASILGMRCDDTYCFLYAQSASAHLKFKVNNAIFFAVTRQALHQDNISCAFFGLHSLDAPSSVDDFKFRMEFKPKPVRQRVVFNPLIEPFINPLTHRMIDGLHRRRPGNYFLSKTEGMLRFYLQGSQSLCNQEWPECLEEKRPLILAS